MEVRQISNFWRKVICNLQLHTQSNHQSRLKKTKHYFVLKKLKKKKSHILHTSLEANRGCAFSKQGVISQGRGRMRLGNRTQCIINPKMRAMSEAKKGKQSRRLEQKGGGKRKCARYCFHTLSITPALLSSILYSRNWKLTICTLHILCQQIFSLEPTMKAAVQNLDDSREWEAIIL